MKSRFARIAVAGLMLTMSAVPLQLLTTSTAFAQASGTAATAAMTNADVVKLAKLGFGSDVIKAKIDSASAVNFKLEVDDLVNLKTAGVSQDVISEMLKRANGATAGSRTPPMGAVMGNPNDVTMVTTDGGDMHLRGISGTISTTNAFVTVLEHYNFQGVSATTRTHDARPSFIVYSADQPKGRIYIVSVEVDSHDQNRSLKLGNSRFWGGMKNVGAPDKDNQIAYDAVAVGNSNQWKLTPTKDLKPGEYGLYMGELFDFGVDR